MTDSTNLALPYLEGAQAQKHVTVNECLRRLDALVLLAVEDKDLTAPPGSPADGARYVPAATATGAWSGKENYVAHYVDGAWEFYAPREGFLAYVRDEDAFYSYDGSAWVRSNRAAHADVSATATLDTTACGRTVRADASAGAVALTLPASPAAEEWVAVQKSDSSANRVTVNAGATEIAWLPAQGDVAAFAFWGGAWTPVRWNIAPLREVFTASGTWTRPPLAGHVEVTCIGAGGGGGTGRRGNAGTNKGGGVGGQGGASAVRRFLAASLGASETVTIGAGGTGAAAFAGPGQSSGANGAAGGNSTFGSHLRGPGGAGGAGGTNSNGADGLPVRAFGGAEAPAQRASSVNADAAAVNDGAGAGTGGNGGGSNSTDVRFEAAAGGTASSCSTAPIAGGAKGGAGADGANGTAATDSVNQVGGSGGGGGGAPNAAGTNGGAGGNGGAPGGGGGGGAAAFNAGSDVTGKGGDGARGEVRVSTYF